MPLRKNLSGAILGGIEMGIIVEVGQIGDGSMAPKETTYNDKPFRRCGVWVDDQFGEIVKDDNGNEVLGYGGRPQRKRKNFQLIFGSDEASGKLFQNLTPGRKILFIGRLSHRPRPAIWNGKSTKKEILTVGNQKVEAFENATVHIMRVEFIDPALSVTLERYKAAAVENGLPEEDADKFVKAVIEQLSSHSEEQDSPASSDQPSQSQEVPPSGDDDGGDPF